MEHRAGHSWSSVPAPSWIDSSAASLRSRHIVLKVRSMLLITPAFMFVPACKRAARRLRASCMGTVGIWIAALAASHAGHFAEAEVAELLPPFY